jgi:DNA-binding MarR family transcriptional regulator
MLERLVQQELVLRSEDPEDRRVKNLVLTEKGAQIIQESIHASQDWFDQLARTLSTSEKEQVVAALNILIEGVKRLDISIE